MPDVAFPRVLAYHKVTSFELGGTWTAPHRFVSQIEALSRSGWRFINEDIFIDIIEGRRKSSGKEILLTFDDGYRHLLDHALPFLEERGISALIFLVSAYAGLPNQWELSLPGRRFSHLSWNECRELTARGFAFGSHTRSHRDLTRLSREDARREIAVSRAEIEDRLGMTVRSFSYPFGRLNDSVAEEVRKAGYRVAFTLYPRLRSQNGDRFELRRDPVYSIDGVWNIECKLGCNGMAVIEEAKGRAINSVAVLTPLIKSSFALARRICRFSRRDT